MDSRSAKYTSTLCILYAISDVVDFFFLQYTANLRTGFTNYYPSHSYVYACIHARIPTFLFLLACFPHFLLSFILLFAQRERERERVILYLSLSLTHTHFFSVNFLFLFRYFHVSVAVHSNHTQPIELLNRHIDYTKHIEFDKK